jgi:hypothetical protein
MTGVNTIFKPILAAVQAANAAGCLLPSQQRGSSTLPTLSLSTMHPLSESSTAMR